MKSSREQKRFNEWNKLKKNIDSKTQIGKIKEGEIWWAAVGKNIKVEINGKNELFSRPVIVLRKINRHSFVGIPLTSQPHDGSWYVKFNFQNRTETAVLIQVRTFSTARLYSRIGQVPNSDLEKVRKGFIDFILNKNVPQSYNWGAGIPESTSILSNFFQKIKHFVRPHYIVDTF